VRRTESWVRDESRELKAEDVIRCCVIRRALAHFRGSTEQWRNVDLQGKWKKLGEKNHLQCHFVRRGSNLSLYSGPEASNHVSCIPVCRNVNTDLQLAL
jgi:hypothetical protein